MAKTKFILPGPETVTISGQTIDKLLRAGDGDAALLYLYILKTRGQSTSDEAAGALGYSAGAIAGAMDVLSRLGLIKLDDDRSGSEPAARVPEVAPVAQEPCAVVTGPSRDAESAALKQSAPVAEPRNYSIDEIGREAAPGSNFAMVVEETQRSLGKILSPDELQRLFGIYDGLRLPAEVILLLVTHCISESRHSGGGRMPSLRNIEKAAYTWEREGIFSLDRAEEYLKALDLRRSVRGEIKRVLQIYDRDFIASEKRCVDAWIANGFGADAVEIAYDRTIIKTGKLVWNYIDKIMNSWHSKNLHTPKEILEKDGRENGNGPRKEQKDSSQKFGAPNQEELRRMEQLLKKIKED